MMREWVTRPVPTRGIHVESGKWMRKPLGTTSSLSRRRDIAPSGEMRMAMED